MVCISQEYKQNDLLFASSKSLAVDLQHIDQIIV